MLDDSQRLAGGRASVEWTADTVDTRCSDVTMTSVAGGQAGMTPRHSAAKTSPPGD